MKRILALLLMITLTVLPVSAAGAAEGTETRVSPTYQVSTQYASSVYYSNLTELCLSGNKRLDLVNVALTQVGYHEGNSESDLDGSNTGGSRNYTEYCRWFGLEILGNGSGFYYDWCAMFVSWAARQARIPTSVINNATYAHAGSSYYYFHVTYHPRGAYTPKPGDLIFYDWAASARQWDHVGIVAFIEEGRVHVVEGNASEQVLIRVVDINNYEIQGWGVPDYGGDASDFTEISSYPVPSRTLAYGASGEDVKWLQTALLQLGYPCPIDGHFGMNTWRNLKSFQGIEGLDPDGVCGPVTRARLMSLLSVAQSGGDPNDPDSYPIPIRTLKFGSVGNDVKWLQAVLKRLGSRIAIDGDFGAETRSAVEIFQRNHGLIVDGIVGPTTRTKLINALAAAGPFVNYPEPVRILKRGMTGDDVKWLQAMLTRLGFPAEVDGAFGPATEQKVIAFQRSAGLVQDGIVGPATLAAIKDRIYS